MYSALAIWFSLLFQIQYCDISCCVVAFSSFHLVKKPAASRCSNIHHQTNLESLGTFALYQNPPNRPQQTQHDRELWSQSTVSRKQQNDFRRHQETDQLPLKSNYFSSSYWRITPDGSSSITSQNLRSLLLPVIAANNAIVNCVNTVLANVGAQTTITAMTVFHTICSSINNTAANTIATLQQYWWSFPMILCLLPFVHEIVLNQSIVTPNFWKMVNIQNIVRHQPDAALVIMFFLGSNIAYYIAGGYLLQKFPARTLAPGLGVWVLLSGAVSTIFHSVQSLGDIQLAEILCYIDHGVAGSSLCYFWNVCGHPPLTIRFWTLAISSLVALCCPLQPGYAWLHSTWHFLSAATAVTWALEGKLQRRQRLFEAIRKQRKQQHCKQLVS